MSTSKLQRQTSALLSIHLGQYTIRENSRPEWLDGLELDFYIEELSVGIEVQGQQHFAYTPHFHESYADFCAQKGRDEQKADLCKHLGVTLYYVEDGREILPLVEQLTGIQFTSAMHPRALRQRKQWITTIEKQKRIELSGKVCHNISRRLHTVRKERNRDHPRPDRIAKYEKKAAAIIQRLTPEKLAIALERLPHWQADILRLRG